LLNACFIHKYSERSNLIRERKQEQLLPVDFFSHAYLQNSGAAGAKKMIGHIIEFQLTIIFEIKLTSMAASGNKYNLELSDFLRRHAVYRQSL